MVGLLKQSETEEKEMYSLAKLLLAHDKAFFE
jgi:hypothetical protein